MIIPGVVATNNTGCPALVQRTGSGTSQDSDDGKIGSDAGWGVSYLGRARSKAGLSLIELWGEEAISALTGAALRDKASLYGGRQRPHFAVQARRRGRDEEVLSRKGIQTAKTSTDMDGKIRS
jgi:hypothetical protein